MPVINVNEVIIRKRMRNVNMEKAKALAKSIEEVGLITPISLANKTLVAGAHRLQAYKFLEFSQIEYNVAGDVNDPDGLELIEIDENLFRNELSAAEKAEHITRRIEIIAKRNIPKKMEEQERQLSKRIEQGKESRKDGKIYQNIGKTAQRAALAEAKKEVAEITGIDKSNINKEIKRHKAVTDTGLDQNKLEDLTGIQYNRVAKIASTEGADAAKKELNYQYDEAVKKQEQKDAGIKQKPKSVVSHDKEAKLKQDISVLVSARSIIKKLTPKDEGLEKHRHDDAYECLDVLIDMLRKNNK